MTARDEVHEQLGYLLGNAALNLEQGMASPTRAGLVWIMEIAAAHVRDALDVIDRYFAEVAS